MALRIYQGTVTAGGTDGTLVSQGDATAPIVIDGLYPSGATAIKNIKLAIRSDTDEIYDDVFLYLVGAGVNEFGFGDYRTQGTSGYGPDVNGRGLLLKNVTNVNRVFNVTAIAVTSEVNTTTTTVKMLVEPGIKRRL